MRSWAFLIPSTICSLLCFIGKCIDVSPIDRYNVYKCYENVLGAALGHYIHADRTEGIMDDVRSRLMEELAKVQKELDRIEEQLQVRGEYGFGKGDPAVYQWELNLSLRDRYRKHREQIEGALVRIDGGEYGICAECGKPIEDERLEALPFTPFCIECARRKD